MPVHRQPLLDQLLTYRSRHPEEAETVDRFIAFVREQPRCFERSLAMGHVTGSAWIVDGEGTRVLLTHHRKLDCWLQLGGHADGDPDVGAVALREAQEESGIADFLPEDDGIFDLDIHPIPARGEVPGHDHYDVRYVLRVEGRPMYVVSEESHDLQWVSADGIDAYSTEESMLRMARKWSARTSSLP